MDLSSKERTLAHLFLETSGDGERERSRTSDTRRDAAASSFVLAIASIHSRSTGSSTPILIAKAASTNVMVDLSSSNACVSTCPFGPVTRTGTIFKNAHDADGFRVFHQASQSAFFIVAQSLSLCSADLRIAQFGSHHSVLCSC
ncbi:hypothetical protein EVAR_56918_1 [Eumeta japonica]|uniref:Uncharacterized protein n=1 Tax=Eumeta variegata TaxID=151549 RepID=A0A4C1YAU9_EUMVA|nr:hypothetical protein EVAR_56918_1 [Eumeta japonica]